MRASLPAAVVLVVTLLLLTQATGIVVNPTVSTHEHEEELLAPDCRSADEWEECVEWHREMESWSTTGGFTTPYVLDGGDILMVYHGGSSGARLLRLDGEAGSIASNTRFPAGLGLFSPSAIALEEASLFVSADTPGEWYRTEDGKFRRGTVIKAGITESSSGSIRWESTVPATTVGNESQVTAVAIAPDASTAYMLLKNRTRTDSDPARYTLVALGGADGGVRWTESLPLRSNASFARWPLVEATATSVMVAWPEIDADGRDIRAAAWHDDGTARWAMVLRDNGDHAQRTVSALTDNGQWILAGSHWFGGETFVTAINATDGSVQWNHDARTVAPTYGAYTIQADAKRVLYVSNDANGSRVVVLDSSTGQPQWTRTTYGEWGEIPRIALGSGHVAIAGVTRSDGRVLAKTFQADDGTEAEGFEVFEDKPSIAGVALSPEHVYVVTGGTFRWPQVEFRAFDRLYTGPVEATAHCLAKTTGAIMAHCEAGAFGESTQVKP